MATLLKIDVSPRGHQSFSRRLGDRFATEWQSNHVGGSIVSRDLATTYIPFVDLPWIAGAFTPPDQHTAEHKAALKVSDELTAELLASDEVLISTPMYNFQIPAVLKGWIDHIVRAGKTFQYGPEGPTGLGGKLKVTVIVASGQEYLPGSPFASYNHIEPYLRTVFGFIGIRDLDVVLAGGTSQVAHGQLTEDAYFEKFAHELDLAASR